MRCLTLSSMFTIFLVVFDQKRVFMNTSCSPANPPIDFQNVKNRPAPLATNTAPTNVIRDDRPVLCSPCNLQKKKKNIKKKLIGTRVFKIFVISNSMEIYNLVFLMCIQNHQKCISIWELISMCFPKEDKKQKPAQNFRQEAFFIFKMKD